MELMSTVLNWSCTLKSISLAGLTCVSLAWVLPVWRSWFLATSCRCCVFKWSNVLIPLLTTGGGVSYNIHIMYNDTSVWFFHYTLVFVSKFGLLLLTA